MSPVTTGVMVTTAESQEQDISGSNYKGVTSPWLLSLSHSLVHESPAGHLLSNPDFGTATHVQGPSTVRKKQVCGMGGFIYNT
jgi:hypothetical protein